MQGFSQLLKIGSRVHREEETFYEFSDLLFGFGGFFHELILKSKLIICTILSSYIILEEKGKNLNVFNNYSC